MARVGSIRPAPATPRITFDETGANYLSLENQLWNANYPSVFVPTMPGIITVTRTAHSDLTTQSVWGLRVVEEEANLVVTVPKILTVPAGGNASFEITIDARNVPLGEVRSATIELHNDTRLLHIPVTIVRGQPIVPLTKTCTAATFPVGGTSNCTIAATNTSFDPATVSVTDTVPDNLLVVPGSVVGATQAATC